MVAAVTAPPASDGQRECIVRLGSAALEVEKGKQPPIRQVALGFVGLLLVTLAFAKSDVLRIKGGLLHHTRWCSYCTAPSAHPGVPPPVQPLPMPELRLPWNPLLTDEELARGVTYHGSGKRLRRMAHKLVAGEPVKVVTLGGSVTAASRLHRMQQSYAALLFRFINSSFPHREHVFHNGGLPGVSSSFFAPCVERLVPQDVDLVTLEFGINDKADVPMDSPSRRAYEQLIRRLLALPGAPAVMLVHHYAWYRSSGDGALEGLFYQEPEAQHTTFAHYYDLPSISVRAAAWRLMAAGINGFKVDKVHRLGVTHPETEEPIPQPEPDEGHMYFYSDAGHPEQTGQQVLAELVTVPLIRAVQEAAAGVRLTPRLDPRLAGLPPAMIPNNPVGVTSICAMLEDFKPMVIASMGFDYVAHNPDGLTFAEQKWSWTGLQPGSWAEMQLDTFSDGSPDRNATVLLVFLRSYKNMGKAWVTCASGCTCEPSKFDSLWNTRASIFTTHQHKVSQHPRCRIRVEITENQKRPQHKVSLSGVMVMH